MRLTPIQIRKQEFAKKLRGYDPDEVAAFLATAASDFEELLKENLELRGQKAAVINELQSYKKLEDTLRSLIIQAEKAATDSAEALRRTSEIVKHEADAKAKDVLDTALREVEQARAKLTEVKDLRAAIIRTIRGVLVAQLNMLDSLESETRKQEPAIESLDVKAIIQSMDNSENGK